MKVIRMSDRRRARQARADALDEALDAGFSRSDDDYRSELDAARMLAASQPPIPVPPEGLVALRAALASRVASEGRRLRSRLLIQAVPGAVAAACVGLVVIVALRPSGSDAQSVENALQQITVKMEAVNQVARADDLPGVVRAAQSARQSLVQAQQVAAPLPASNPLRDVLLQTAEAKITQLEALLQQLKLPPVPSLPPVPGVSSGGEAAGPLGTTSTSTSSSTTSTSTTNGPTTTTSTTLESANAATQGGGSGSTTTSSTSSTTTTSANSATGTKSGTSTTTTSSTTTSSTTPVPPPPSTTSTTAPPPPPGG